jgi:hypothetical protein
MNTPQSNEDKLAWCEHGDSMEKKFVIKSMDSGLSIFRNPAKKKDPYVHDIFAVIQSDIKSIKTPFNTAHRYGIDSEYAITINEKDVVRYNSLYPNIMLLLDIEYPKYKGVRLASLYRINRLIEMDRAKKHTYLNRVDDKSGNAKASYIFDYRWFDEVTL